MREEEVDTVNEFVEIVGESLALKLVLTQARDAARTRKSLLISGEPGTGKELIARAIHRMGERRAKSFVNVDCSCLSPSLLERNLFEPEVGLLERAHLGTLLLKHVHSVEPRIRSRIQQVLEQKQLERPGIVTASPIDFRLIGTAPDLGRGSEDSGLLTTLFCKMNSVAVRIPPLRDRRDDIPPLARHFVAKWARRTNKSIKFISARTMKLFLNHDWPNNVRELETVVENAIRSAEGPALQIDSQTLSGPNRFSRGPSATA